MKIRKKLNDKRKRGGAEKVGQSGIGRKSLPLIVISFLVETSLIFKFLFSLSITAL